MNRSRAIWTERALIPVAVLAGLLPLAAGAARAGAPDPSVPPPAPPMPEPAAAEAGTPRVGIEFDFAVPLELLRLIDGKIIDDDSLDAWVDLPGNAELLRLGALRGNLDREELRENLWHSVLGHASRRGDGLGTLEIDPVDDIGKMVSELQSREQEIRERVARHLELYLPAAAPAIKAVVRLHLGGTWDGRTREDVFLNLSFLHEFRQPWFGAAEGILAHEVTHLIHRQLDVLPEDAASPAGLFAVAITQIHSEGIARQIEMGLLQDEYPQGTYAAFVTSRYRDGLAGFTQVFQRVEEIREACLRKMDSPVCLRLIRSGLWRGGETYAVGQGMARAIEKALGRRILGTTFEGGAVKFFELYGQATRMLPELPALGEGFEADLAAAGAFLAERREPWRLKRDARASHARGDYDGAASALRALLAIEAADAIAAYNLSCALARKGDSGGALEWLEKAIDLGYTNRAHIEADPDMDSLRGARAYRTLVDRLAGRPPEDPNGASK